MALSEGGVDMHNISFDRIFASCGPFCDRIEDSDRPRNSAHGGYWRRPIAYKARPLVDHEGKSGM